MKILEQLKFDGISVTLEDGKIRVGGKKTAVSRWLPEIRRMKSELIEALTTQKIEALSDSEVSEALRNLQNNGVKPWFFTKPIHCEKCGFVFERFWADDETVSCAWCHRIFNGNIPRPERKDIEIWRKQKTH